MKGNNKILKPGILAFVATCFMFYSLSYAAPPLTQSIQPVPATKVLQTPSVPATKVLQTPLILNEAIISSMSLYKSLLAATDRVHKAYSPLKNTDCPSGWFVLEETFYGGYNSYIQSCANKSYSVQDQQNAGCLGSDTVDQCTNKLLRHCLSRYEQDKFGYKNQPDGDLKTKIIKGIEKSDRIRNEAQELSDALKTLKNLMP